MFQNIKQVIMTPIKTENGLIFVKDYNLEQNTYICGGCYASNGGCLVPTDPFTLKLDPSKTAVYQGSVGLKDVLANQKLCFSCTERLLNWLDRCVSDTLALGRIYDVYLNHVIERLTIILRRSTRDILRDIELVPVMVRDGMTSYSERLLSFTTRGSEGRVLVTYKFEVVIRHEYGVFDTWERYPRIIKEVREI